MFKIESLEDIETLRETSEVECKLAAGKDGQGRLPDDFWPTYSAFANKRGGYIILGVRADSDDDAHAFRKIDAQAFRYFDAHPLGRRRPCG